MISYRLLTQHIPYALAMNAAVTQHISAGDSFFLLPPVFILVPLHVSSNGFFFPSCTLYNYSVILYSIFTDIELYYVVLYDASLASILSVTVTSRILYALLESPSKNLKKACKVGGFS